VGIGFGVRATEAAAVADAGGPYTGVVGVPVQFSAANTTGAVSYLWDFGDGTQSTGITPTHVYNNVGIFKVQLTATDALGQTSVAGTFANISFVDSSGIVTLPAPAVSALVTPQCPFGTVVVNGFAFCASSPAVISPLVTTTPLCPFGVDPVTLTC